MPKKRMTDAQKRAMQLGRVKGKKEREAALEALANPQFQNARFWRTVEPDVLAGVKKAIEEAQRIVRREAATKLKPELEKELNRLASLQAATTAARTRVKELRAELKKLGGD